MRDILSDFEGLAAYLKASDEGYLPALLSYYIKLGEGRGFTTVEGAQVISGSYDYGKVDLAWVEPNMMFCFEFGNLDDIYRHLFRFMVAAPSLGVLILSSKSKCKPQTVRDIIEATPQLKKRDIAIVDVGSMTLL